jgi:predicted acylesterase/phospholipase RssA
MGSDDVPASVPQVEHSVLRFAVAMRGGVSLAVWIGGAMQEIDHLRRDEDFAHHVLGVTRFDRLEVDIITGASAGGLNAALAGMAIAHGTSLACLRDVWMDTADIDRLLDLPGPRATVGSLLNGEYFRLEVVRWLKELASPSGGDDDHAATLPAAMGGDGAGGSPVEILLAATVFGGVPVVEATDPTFTDRRRQAYFHFRHLAVSPAFSDTCGRPEAAERLGRAARASASFPVAFDPVVLDSDSFRGRLQLPAGAPIPTTLRLFDGGILDNIPVARAIRAAAASPAQEPVRRWVVYLHPSPTLPKPLAAESDGSEAPHVFKVVADLVAGRGVETLLDDLEVLQNHNREAESQRLQRYSACRAALDALPGAGHDDGDDGLASVDADHLFNLLADPTTMLGWIPIGRVPPVSPIEGIEEDACSRMRASFLDQLVAAGTTVRPFARLVRLSHLAVEWIRSVEGRGARSQPDLRREVYDILLIARLVDSALDMVFIESADERVDRLVAALDGARRSPALHALAGYAGCASDPAREPLRERLQDDAARDTLDLLATGELPSDVDVEGAGAPAEAPLDGVLLDRLAGVGRSLAGAGRSLDSAGPTGLFRLLEASLGEAPTVGAVGRTLLAVDSACAGLHRGRAVGAPLSLEYVRISGAAGSPLATGSSFPPGVLAQFRDLTQVAGRIDPRAKLSGNSLANFSAFLSRRFRANDWMWGRMDAASGLVDILVRPEHLARAPDGGKESVAALRQRVEAAVLAPFASVTDPGVRQSAEVVFRRLWEDNRSLVHGDLNSAITDAGATLDSTRQLLTARWQLEIFLSEVPDLLASPLLPEADAEPFPQVAAPADDDLAAASQNIATVMAAYEDAPRRAADLWGSRKTTALGVRVARNLSRSLVPGGGPAAVTLRTLASVPIMIATAALLARGAFLVACSLLLNVVLVPRLEHGSLFQWVVLGLSTAGSLLFWALLVRRRSGRGRWRGWVALGLTLAIQAFGWAVLASPGIQKPFATPEPVAASAPWVSAVATGPALFGAVVVAIATGIAWFLLLIWAKKPWALAEAVLIGVVWGWWVVVGAWEPAGRLGVPARLQAALGSLWIPALALVILSAGVTVAVRIEDRGRPRR